MSDAASLDVGFKEAGCLAALRKLKKHFGTFVNTTVASPSQLLTLDAHTRAMNEISTWPEYRPTPLIHLASLASAAGVKRLWYKDESSRFGLGSFKALGGSYAVLRVLQKELAECIGREPTSQELRSGVFAYITQDLTVTTATEGNHGRAVAWGAQQFGCRSVVYVPRSCSNGRRAAIARYGAKVVRAGLGYDDTVRRCLVDAACNSYTVVSDTSWSGYIDTPSEVMNGYTVLAEEVLRQLPADDRLTHVFVQAGVGGFAASLCSHFLNRLSRAAPAIIIVEPQNAACLFASAAVNTPTSAPTPNRTIMAGLDCAKVSILAWDILSANAAAFTTVPDTVVKPCVRLLAAAPYSIVAGESAVAGLAAALISSGDPDLRRKLRLKSDSQVLVIGTEGNTDPKIYQSLIAPEGTSR